MPSAHPPQNIDDINAKNKKVVKLSIGVIIGMFLFGFASIPIYRMVCERIDPGGSAYFTGEADSYEGVTVDETRQIRVRFATNVERQLPWHFDVAETFVTVHPGEKRMVTFSAENKSSFPSIGKAVYDINPPWAAPYFKKIECFCFTNQSLNPLQAMDMPLIFWFDPDIPERVTEVTLGYTFFNSDTSRSRATR